MVWIVSENSKRPIKIVWSTLWNLIILGINWEAPIFWVTFSFGNSTSSKNYKIVTFSWFNKFNSSKNSSPIYGIYKKSIIDFCFLNEGSIFSTLSQGQKNCINIWDTLLPARKSSIVNEYAMNGTNIHYSSQKKILIFSNFKRNSLSYYDLRKNMISFSVDVKKCEFLIYKIFFDRFLM